MNRRELLILCAGAAIAWPLAAPAQQKAMPVIGFLGRASSGPFAPFAAVFHQGPGETGKRGNSESVRPLARLRLPRASRCRLESLGRGICCATVPAAARTRKRARPHRRPRHQRGR